MKPPLEAVFDTNILVDYLRGIEGARREIRRHARRVISVIAWAEVLVGARTADEEAAIREFLATFELVGLDRPIAEEAVRLRRRYRVRLPDALIWATARCRGAVLVTRNTKDFPVDEPDIRVPPYSAP